MTGAALAPEADQRARENANLAILAGPLVELIQKPLTLDVCVNPNKKIWVNTLGSGWSCVGEFFDSRIFLQGVASMRDITLNRESPILETTFPITEDRIQGIIEPIVSGSALAMRSRQKVGFSLEDTDASGVLSHRNDPQNAVRNRNAFLEESAGLNHLGVLRLAARYRQNVMIVGPTGSGKTTFANVLMKEWASETPNDRVVMIEDTPELQCPLRNAVQLLARDRISQADLLVSSLRLIPDRIVLGEVRKSSEAKVLVDAFSTGHSGLVTLHANDSFSGLRRLETLLGDHTQATREMVAAAIHVVVFIDLDKNISAGRKVREVLFVHGVDKATGDYSVEYL